MWRQPDDSERGWRGGNKPGQGLRRGPPGFLQWLNAFFYTSRDITRSKHGRAASTFGKHRLSLVQIRHGYVHADSPGDNLQVSHSDLVRRLVDGLKKKEKKKFYQLQTSEDVSLFHRFWMSDFPWFVLLVNPGWSPRQRLQQKSLCSWWDHFHFRSDFLFARVSICDFYDWHQQIPSMDVWLDAIGRSRQPWLFFFFF